MQKWFSILFILFSACTLPAEKEQKAISEKADTTIIETNDVNAAIAENKSDLPPVKIQKVNNPSGIYQAVLPLKDKVQQTILFNNDHTYQLQEKYSNGKKDSVVFTVGNWAPSDGYIWLYKEQVVRGRYKWKDNELQYYSPAAKKSFPMNHLKDAMENGAWKNKGKEGILIFGVGNEPFWSVEYTNKDSISFLLSEWTSPFKLKADSSFNTTDSSGYIARNDSTQLRVTIFPQFCSDGMSDFVYRNKIRVQYNNQVFNGCGILYK